MDGFSPRTTQGIMGRSTFSTAARFLLPSTGRQFTETEGLLFEQRFNPKYKERGIYTTAQSKALQQTPKHPGYPLLSHFSALDHKRLI